MKNLLIAALVAVIGIGGTLAVATSSGDGGHTHHHVADHTHTDDGSVYRETPTPVTTGETTQDVLHREHGLLSGIWLDTTIAYNHSEWCQVDGSPIDRNGAVYYYLFHRDHNTSIPLEVYHGHLEGRTVPDHCDVE